MAEDFFSCFTGFHQEVWLYTAFHQEVLTFFVSKMINNIKWKSRHNWVT